MTIIRAPRTNNFTIIPNQALRDSSLSYRARGILAAILSQPDNWQTSSERLARQGKEGRDSIRAALQELETAGYIRRVRQQNSEGRFETITFIFDSPQEQDDNTEGGFPGVGKPGVGRPAVGEPGAKERLLKETFKKKEQPPLPPNPLPAGSAHRDKSRDAHAPGGERRTRRSVSPQRAEADSIVAEAWTPHQDGSAQDASQVARIVETTLKNGRSREDLTKALAELARSGDYVSAYSLTGALKGRSAPSWAPYDKSIHYAADRKASPDEYSEDL